MTLRPKIKNNSALFSPIVLTMIFLFFYSFNYAQSDSLKNARALYFQNEMQAQKGNYNKAISGLLELIDKYPTFINPYFKITELYYLKRDKASTLFYAEKAFKINANESYPFLSKFIIRMKKNKDYDEAKKLSEMITPYENEINEKKAKIKLTQNKDYPYIDNTPILGIQLKNLGDSINTKENEYLPSLSLDESTLVFTRNVKGNEDFFIAKKDSNQVWHKAFNMGYPPNTNLPDGGAKLSADGNYLFYTRCDMRSPDGIRGGGCDIVFSFREDSSWSPPQYFGYTINTTAYEGQPCINSDNTTLYFVSNREGGYGGMDIWMSKFVKGVWEKPENLGPTINTAKDETSPFIHPDDETLYFSSNGHPGLGQSDLFISRKNKNGIWQTPVNLGAPINSEGFEGAVVIDAKGKKGYFATERNDSRGGLDIYTFDVYSAIKPTPTICLKGFVKDKYFKTPIKRESIQFYRLLDNQLVGVEKSNMGDASYTRALQMGRNYLITCFVDEYRPFYKKISLLKDTLPDILNIDIKLKQPGLIDTLYQEVFLFDSLHSQLDSISYRKIDTLIKKWSKYLEDSASVVVFLKGYYYSGDSEIDSTYKENIQSCMYQLQAINNYFERMKFPCHFVMQDPTMIIWRDDEEIFRTVEMKIVEYY